MYIVVAQRQIPVSVERVWDYLTKPELLAQWFADTSYFGPNAPVLMETGDGDFFSGTVIEWVPGIVLGLRWKFDGCGPEFEVHFSLLRRKQGTEITVHDRGSLTVEEAECLRVGWSEFLMRLEKCLLRNVNTRFLWRKVLILTLRVAAAKRDQLMEALEDPHWYEAALPGVRARVHHSHGNEIVAALTCDAWGQVETRAQFKTKNVAGTVYAYLVHEGWFDLPSNLALAERKRFVPLWIDALSPFEMESSSLHLESPAMAADGSELVAAAR